LIEIEPRWAAAWVRVQKGDSAFTARQASSKRNVTAPPARTGTKPWALGVLGLSTPATVPEIKRAFRALALRTHPDRGGDEAAFIDAKRAYDVALATAETRSKLLRTRRAR
jgi:hypothetical protein